MEDQTQTPERTKDAGLAGWDSQLGHRDAHGPQQLPHPNDSLLQRIDRLDAVVNTMEERVPTELSSCTSSASARPTSNRHSDVVATASELEKRCKSTKSVLKEVHAKGTLVERVADLETRVIKLERALSGRLNERAEAVSAIHGNDLMHRRVISCGDACDKQLLQDPIGVEKHEVVQFHSDRPSQETSRRVPLVDSGSHNTKLEDCPNGMQDEVTQDSVSSSEESTDIKQQARKDQPQLSEKNLTRMRKWLSRRLHIHLLKSPSKGNGNHRFANGQGCGHQIHPLSCCNAGRKPSTSTNTNHGYMPTYGRDSFIMNTEREI